MSPLADWAWAQEGLKPAERLVLLALAHRAKGVICYPSLSVLHADTALSAEEIADAVKVLGGRGLIARMPVEGGTAAYLTIPKLPKPKKAAAPVQDTLEMQQAFDIWNEMAERTGLARVRKLTDDMKRKLAVRLAEGGIDLWAQAVNTIENNAHCRGLNSTKWKADFHYLLQAKGFSKTINGGWPADYQEKSNGGQRTDLAGRGDERTQRLRSLIQRNVGRPSGGADGGGGGGNDHPHAGADGRGPRPALGGPEASAAD